MAGLELQHIEKTFGRSRGLHDVSFEVGDGEFIVFAGSVGMRQIHVAAHHRRA